MAESSLKKQEFEQAPEPTQHQEPKNQTPNSAPKSAFAFWGSLTILVSLVTLILASLMSQDQRSWFLTLPDDLRHHHSTGKLIKVQFTPNRPSTLIFVADHGPKDASETVLLLHGLGSSSFSFRHVIRSLAASGLRAVALDLPGSGFSEPLDADRTPGGPLGWILGIYHDIREKGIFWGFDQLIQNGQIPYEERQTAQEHSSGYQSIEFPWVVGQVVDSMLLSPVHLVLHDSALGTGANWVSMSPSSVRSVTLIDASAETAAFPSGLLGVPVLAQVLMGSRYVFTGLLKLCCSRSIDGVAAEGYRLLLKGSGRMRVVEAGKALNFSFDLGEWAESEAARNLPVQVLWSNSWSDMWIDEGRRVAAAVPRAKLASHSGGRWPQEDAVGEITKTIAQFVFSLPKSTRQNIEEPVPQHIQRMFDEANSGQHNHRHDHGHDHAAGYMNMYGMDQGWGS